MARCINDGDARAASGQPIGPGAKTFRVVEARRSSRRHIRNRQELAERGAHIILPDSARRVEVYGEKNSEDEGEISQPKVPEEPSSHGSRTDNRRPVWFSYKQDAVDRLRLSRGDAARIRRHCVVSQIFRSPKHHREVDHG